jgi:hypothetical protein
VPSASHMLNHFAYFGGINVTSAFVVVALLPQLFLASRLKKTLRAKNEE